MQYYKDGFRGGNPDIKQAAPNRRNRGPHEPLPETVDVLIAGTDRLGQCPRSAHQRFLARAHAARGYVDWGRLV